MSNHFFTVFNKLRVSYDVLEGSSKLIYLLLPSLGDIKGEYRFLSPMLNQNGLHPVYSIDLRGMGNSDVNFPSYTPLDSGKDLDLIIKGLSLKDPDDKFVLIGTSMSAACVAFAAASNIEKVKGIVMISPFLWDHPMPFGIPTLLSAFINSCTGPSFWASYYTSLYTLRERPVADLNEFTQILKRNLAEPGRITALRGHVFGSKASCEARVKEINDANISVFPIFGTLDPDFHANVAPEITEFRSRFPNNLHPPLEINGAGHYPHVEDPIKVFEGILAFVNTLKL